MMRYFAAKETKVAELKGEAAVLRPLLSLTSHPGGVSDREQKARAMAGDESAQRCAFTSIEDLSAELATIRRAIEIATQARDKAAADAAHKIAVAARPDYLRIVAKEPKQLRRRGNLSQPRRHIVRLCQPRPTAASPRSFAQ